MAKGKLWKGESGSIIWTAVNWDFFGCFMKDSLLGKNQKGLQIKRPYVTSESNVLLSVKHTKTKYLA